MPTIRLTQAAVERVRPPTSGRVEYNDKHLPGFMLRVTDTGAKSWACFYRIKGKNRRLTLGTLQQIP
jgi:hypothetical protein